MTVLPPPQYDVPPPMPVIEQVLPWSEVQKMCAWAMLHHGGYSRLMNGAYLRVPLNGCSMRLRDGQCWIIRIDDADVRRHERAHCNGWPGDHPR